MFEILFPFVYIFFGTAISLGVGSSSVVIAGFLTALSDGEFDAGERRILGVIYWSLRIAMISIVITLAALTIHDPQFLPSVVYYWLLTVILFINAFLMTKHRISSKVGPALQAATWYTLGFIASIDMFSLYIISPLFFTILYGVDIIIAIVLVNGLLKYFDTKNSQSK